MTLSHAILAVGISAVFFFIGGFLTAYIFDKPVAAIAESGEQFAAKQIGSVGKVANQAASKLQTPGK